MEVRKIALVLESLAVGGAERVTLELGRGFVGRGLTVDLVTVDGSGPFRSQIPEGVRLVDLNSGLYTCAPRLAEYMRRERPDVLISTLVLTDLVTLLARRCLSGIPQGEAPRVYLRLATTISQLPRPAWKKRLERLLLSAIYPTADRIIADSQGVADDLCSYAGIDPSLMTLIYDPVLTPALRAQESTPTEHPWFEDGQTRPLILSMGRLSPEKDFPTLLRAFALLLADYPPERERPRLVILGDGPQRAQLEALASELGIRDDLALPGFVMNPGAYLRKGSLYVLSSTLEGLPGALIQALGCGLPAVATNCPSGPFEVLQGGRSGHLVPVGDTRAMADAMRAVLDGDTRLPPAEWLRSFETENVIARYLEVMREDANG